MATIVIIIPNGIIINPMLTNANTPSNVENPEIIIPKKD